MSICNLRHIKDGVRQSRGFTIVELLVAMTISGLLIGILFGPLNDLYTSNTSGLKTTVADADGHAAMQSIRLIVMASNQLKGSITGNPDSITDPDGTAWAGGATDTLVASNYATWTNAGQRNLVEGGATCNKLSNYYVFFRDNVKKALYRRTLTSRGVVTPCDGASWDQKQTCGLTVSFPRCQAKDVKLLSNVKSFSMTYYTSTVGMTTTSDPTAAKAVLVTIEQNNGNFQTIKTKMRINLANGG